MKRLNQNFRRDSLLLCASAGGNTGNTGRVCSPSRVPGRIAFPVGNTEHVPLRPSLRTLYCLGPKQEPGTREHASVCSRSLFFALCSRSLKKFPPALLCALCSPLWGLGARLFNTPSLSLAARQSAAQLNAEQDCHLYRL